MIGECAYCQVLEVKQNCFSICVDFCENVIMGITGEIGIDDLNAWKEWIVLGEPKALKCIENQNTSDVAEMPKFEVVWSRRVETPIMHVTRLKDGKLLGYLSFVGHHEIMFQFSIWELQMPEVNVKLLASKLFSGSDICNYHITCCTPMTFTAEYFATGHKNGEIYIWSYDPDIEGNLNYKLLADDDVQKNGVSLVTQLPNGYIVSSGYKKDKAIKVNSGRGNIRKILIHSKCITDFAVLTCDNFSSSMSNVRLVSLGEDRILNFTSMDEMRVKVKGEEKLPKFFSMKSLFNRPHASLG